MDVQSVSGGAPSFGGQLAHGGAQPEVAREPENANGTFMVVSVAGKTAKNAA